MDERFNLFKEKNNQILLLATLDTLNRCQDNGELKAFLIHSLGNHLENFPKKWPIHQAQPLASFSNYVSEMDTDDQSLAIMFALAVYLHHKDGLDSAKMIKTREFVKDLTLLTHHSPLMYLGNLLFVLMWIHLLSALTKKKRPLGRKKRQTIVSESILDWLTLLEHQHERKYLSYFVRLAAQIGDRNRLESPSAYLRQLSVNELHHRNNIIDTLEMVMYHLNDSTFDIKAIPFHPLTADVIDVFAAVLISPPDVMHKVSSLQSLLS